VSGLRPRDDGGRAKAMMASSRRTSLARQSAGARFQGRLAGYFRSTGRALPVDSHDTRRCPPDQWIQIHGRALMRAVVGRRRPGTVKTT